MVINTNTSALSGARLLSDSSNQLSKSLAKLSSGSRLTSPDTDAAGAAVSFRFDAQINRIAAANNNISNATSLLVTTDGFLGNVAKSLDRMSELTVLAQDATKSDADRQLYQKEFSTLGSYITDIATKDFNGVSLFSGQDLSVTTDSDGNTFTATGVNLGASQYTTAVNSNINTTSSAATALTNVKSAITQLATDRATVGANMASLNHRGSQLSVLKDNLTAANSRIKDVNVAEESTNFARLNILVQAGTAMLAQANASSQTALRLIS